MSPQTQQLLQNSGARVRVCESLTVPALSDEVVNLCCSPPRHCSGPFSQVQTEISFLSQTYRPRILTRSGLRSDV